MKISQIRNKIVQVTTYTMVTNLNFIYLFIICFYQKWMVFNCVYTWSWCSWWLYIQNNECLLLSSGYTEELQQHTAVYICSGNSYTVIDWYIPGHNFHCGQGGDVPPTLFKILLVSPPHFLISFILFNL